MMIVKKTYEYQKQMLEGLNFIQKGGVLINTGGGRMGKREVLKLAKEYKKISNKSL